MGDDCDSDWDNDAVLNTDDNFVRTVSPQQEDLDQDDLGDALMTLMEIKVPNAEDNFPLVSNGEEEDAT